MRNMLKRAAFGILQALMGAYLGVVLFFVLGAIIISLTEPQTAGFSWTGELRSLRDLFAISLGGVIAYSWWVIPAGAFFGGYLQPKLRQWPRDTALIRGVLLGATFGLITAALLAITSLHDGIPRRTIKTSFAFFPAYCGAWCGWYARRIARVLH